ncbi:MAG: NADH-quinone oxidoreductase subunit NuoF [Dethiobacteria bacterium]
MQIKSPESLTQIREEYRKAFKRQKTRFLVCAGTGCVASGSLGVFQEFERILKEKGLYADTEIIFEEEEIDSGVAKSGCHGFCQMGPLVRFEPEGIFYTKVTVEDVAEIIEASLEKNTVVERLLYQNPDETRSQTEHEVPFYSNQQRIVLGKCGIINPEDIREYIAAEGYQGLADVLSGYTPKEVVEAVEKSGLRGRGGGGFSTGKKWSFVFQASGSPKYVVCNGDEGDPGAFMDRSVLEGDPCAVLEGMTIAAYAIGARRGFIYARAEYPLAIKRLKIAIEQAKQYGLLGSGIMGTDFDFDIDIFQGAGAFVCGEETALLASIEGNRGMPRPRPPFPAHEGLWGKPTLLNNVKTFAFIPQIIKRGPEWFASTGTKGSPGTAIFALTGKVKNCGLIEVPMGIKVRDVIFTIGGGMLNSKEFKAVQTGGPSGGCLPAALLDMEVDFDSLRSAGAMMGSGGMVVMDEGSCMVDIARYFLEFTVDESCGRCVPCREGIKQMYKTLVDITKGRGRPEDLDLLERIGKNVIKGAICGLGKTAPNPVLSTLRYFRDEYEAHVRDHACPALVCKELIAYYIDPEKCKACGRCRKECPEGAIVGEKKVPHVIDQSKCSKCGICFENCPDRFAAVTRITGEQKKILEGISQ